MAVNHDYTFADKGRNFRYHFLMMSKGKGAKSAVAIGTFDGVHIGHQRILDRLNDVASKKSLQRIAYAFVFPPRLTVQAKTRGLLLSEEAKLKLLIRHVDRVERVSFEDVSRISAESFIRDIIIAHLKAKVIVVGSNFRFGHDRTGDTFLLRKICNEESTATIVVPPVVIDGSPVSSTRIRQLISQGRVEDAAVLLGRHPILVGRVMHGDRLGRKIGFPTANLAIDERILLPSDGIYLAHAFWNGGWSPGLLYVGTRPTVHGTDRRIEVHLIAGGDQFDERDRAATRDLYGKIMEIHLVQKLRDDQHFATLKLLRQQIERDIECARGVLATLDEPQGPIVT
ncbi:riboflavin biosynthesis protein RibF [Candidatus Bipolaricaulota bacterium]|nr:riboflavin biosynthesis protein RibF [Candidatus Bipolaricaulota bacterium]